MSDIKVDDLLGLTIENIDFNTAPEEWKLVWLADWCAHRIRNNVQTRALAISPLVLDPESFVVTEKGCVKKCNKPKSAAPVEDTFLFNIGDLVEAFEDITYIEQEPSKKREINVEEGTLGTIKGRQRVTPNNYRRNSNSKDLLGKDGKMNIYGVDWVNGKGTWTTEGKLILSGVRGQVASDGGCI